LAATKVGLASRFLKVQAGAARRGAGEAGKREGQQSETIGKRDKKSSVAPQIAGHLRQKKSLRTDNFRRSEPIETRKTQLALQEEGAEKEESHAKRTREAPRSNSAREKATADRICSRFLWVQRKLRGKKRIQCLGRPHPRQNGWGQNGSLTTVGKASRNPDHCSRDQQPISA